MDRRKGMSVQAKVLLLEVALAIVAVCRPVSNAI